MNREHNYLNLMAGAVSGAAGASVTAPLDLVKTILQCQPKTAQTQSMMTLLKNIIRQEGTKACFRGLGATLAGIIPNYGIFFLAYDSSKDFFNHRYPSMQGTPSALAASSVAGVVSTIVTNPIWVVKTRMQTSAPGTYQGMHHCFSNIYQSEGVRPFFAGLSASLIGVSHICVQFPIYEYLKIQLKRSKGPHEFEIPGNEKTDLAGILIASGVSKIISSVVTYPHEVVRARLQNQSLQSGIKYTGLMDACKKIAIEEGFSAFFNGMTANLIKSVPACVITFSVYEILTTHVLAHSA